MLRGEQSVFRQGSRRHDTLHAPFHRAAGGGRVADLFADGDGLARLDELGQVAVDGVERNPGHGDGTPGRLAACRQRDVEEVCGALGVVVEQFVEVAHPVEQQGVRVLRLDAQVLLHHGRVGSEVHTLRA